MNGVEAEMTPETLERIRKRHYDDWNAGSWGTNHGWGYHHAHADRGLLLAEVDRLRELLEHRCEWPRLCRAREQGIGEYGSKGLKNDDP
jgi:hypothetical protein